MGSLGFLLYAVTDFLCTCQEVHLSLGLWRDNLFTMLPVPALPCPMISCANLCFAWQAGAEGVGATGLTRLELLWTLALLLVSLRAVITGT